MALTIKDNTWYRHITSYTNTRRQIKIEDNYICVQLHYYEVKS